MECKFKDLNEALRLLDVLKQSVINYSGKRSTFWAFTHLAQSIHFSLVGFPKLYPKWLRNTIGQLIIYYFLLRGKMSHNLSVPIPGAPVIPEEGNVEEALKKLQKTFKEFFDFQGRLAPHFLYGSLNKERYLQAHLMHLANHLTQIEIIV